MTPVSKSLAFAAWCFKRNSRVFVSCPSPVPSPSPQPNYFFPFLKEALRWKERRLALRCFMLWDFYFFLRVLQTFPLLLQVTGEKKTQDDKLATRWEY